jgi:hypothetical protein
VRQPETVSLANPGYPVFCAVTAVPEKLQKRYLRCSSGACTIELAYQAAEANHLHQGLNRLAADKRYFATGTG